MKALLFLLVCLVAALGHPHSDEQKGKDRVAALQFVQEFYDWYVPKASKLAVDPVKDALRSKAAWFASELRKALLEDIEAQQKARDEIVGLDFDPFLNGQDPGVRYVVVGAKAKGKTWLVSLHAVAAGMRSSKPAVVAVVEQGEKGWRFVNFEYPGGDDLRTILKNLRNERSTEGLPHRK